MRQAMPQMIDAHQHFIDRDRFPYPWIEPSMPVLHRPHLPQDLRPALDQAGIDRTILVQASLCCEETRWYLGFSRQYPWIAGVVGWANLIGTELERTLDEYQAMGRLVGIRWCGNKDTDWVGESVLRGLRILEKRGLPVDWLTVFPNDLVNVPEMAKRLPGLRIVIDHLAKPKIALGRMDGWQEGMMAAAACPNVYCKLSGLGTEARPDWVPADFRPYLKHTVAAFGFKRLMFGSDWPVCLRAASSYRHMLDSLLEALGPLDAARRGRLMGETAAEFYHISKE